MMDVEPRRAMRAKAKAMTIPIPLEKKVCRSFGVPWESANLDYIRAMLRQAAHHEAGHALAAIWLTPAHVEFVTLDPYLPAAQDSALGQHSTNGLTRTRLPSYADDRHEAVITLGGPVAGAHYAKLNRGRRGPKADRTADAAEQRRARHDLTRANGGWSYREVREWVEKTIQADWPVVVRVAEALLERETLTGDDVVALL